jgi:cation diffusion facilitator CzcD-associated flavoprotein CzcO
MDSPESQEPLSLDHVSDPTAGNLSSVAIIGAGIAGAAVAYYLHEKGLGRTNPSTTVFERQSHVGGRAKTVPWRSTEVGAQGIHLDDWCMVLSAREAGLETITIPSPKSVGIWNGNELFHSQDFPLASRNWKHMAKMVWTYGLSTWRFEQAVSDIFRKLATFRAM